MAINFFKVTEFKDLNDHIEDMHEGDLAIVLKNYQWYIKHGQELHPLDTGSINTNQIVDQAITMEKIDNKVLKRYVVNYGTVMAMKDASNLIDGMLVHTNGFYAFGDGGSAWYEINTEGPANEIDVLAINETDPQLFAHFIKIEDEVNLKQLGARCDGKNFDNTVFNYALSNNNYFRLKSTGEAKINQKIVIPANKKINFATIKCDIDDYAIAITTGSGGQINIENIINETGGGVEIITNGNSPVNIIEACDFNFNKIEAKETCLNFANNAGVLDCKFSGTFWKTTGEFPAINTINISNYVGQLNFNVNRIISSGDFAINLDSTFGKLTGLNFGYCSLESSKNGIQINAKTNDIEPIRGIFRVVEFVDSHENLNDPTNPPIQTILKIKGDAARFVGTSEITFDRYDPTQIDLSELIIPKQYNNYNILVINGPLISAGNGERFVLTNKANIKPVGLQFKPNVSGQMDIVTNNNNNTAWKTNKTTSNRYISAGADVNILNIPSWWEGDELYLNINNEEGTIVKASYSLETGTPLAEIQLSQGKHSVIMTYDQDGVGTLRESGGGGSNSGGSGGGPALAVSDRLLHSDPITAYEIINAGHIIGGGTNGYHQLTAGATLNIAYPILYANSSIEQFGTSIDTYEVMPNVNFLISSDSIEKNNDEDITNKMLWLKGTLSGSTFTCASENWLTTIIPTTENEMIYIPLGIMTGNETGYFNPTNQLWIFKSGSFQLIESVTRNDVNLLQNINSLMQISTDNGLSIKNSTNSFERVSTESFLTIPPSDVATNQLIGTLPISNGGTGATTANEAITNLGITASAISAAPENHNHNGTYLRISGEDYYKGHLIIKDDRLERLGPADDWVSEKGILLRDKNEKETGGVYIAYSPRWKDPKDHSKGQDGIQHYLNLFIKKSDDTTQTDYINGISIGYNKNNEPYIWVTNRGAWHQALHPFLIYDGGTYGTTGTATLISGYSFANLTYAIICYTVSGGSDDKHPEGYGGYQSEIVFLPNNKLVLLSGGYLAGSNTAANYYQMAFSKVLLSSNSATPQNYGWVNTRYKSSSSVDPGAGGNNNYVSIVRMYGIY